MKDRRSVMQGYGKWIAYALVLLAPGSFVVLAAVWLARIVRRWQAARCVARPPANAASA
jgi:hypothetical protein